jgi:hypothetical protein
LLRIYRCFCLKRCERHFIWCNTYSRSCILLASCTIAWVLGFLAIFLVQSLEF